MRAYATKRQFREGAYMPRFVRLLTPLLLLGVLSAPGVARAQTVAALQPGQTLVYRMHIVGTGTATFNGASIPVNSDMTSLDTIKVVSVDPKAGATVTVTTANQGGSINGQPLPPSKVAPVPLTLHVGTDGKVTDPAGMALGMNAFGVVGTDVPPGQALTPGATWTQHFDQPLPGSGSTLHASVNGSVLRSEQVNGHADAVIQSSLTMPATFDMDLSKMAPPGAQAPTNVPPVLLHSTGQVTASTTSDVDASSRWLDKSTTQESVDLTLSYSGIPKPAATPAGSPPAGPSGPIHTVSHETIDLQRVPS
jgi:hypothetical protein